MRLSDENLRGRAIIAADGQMIGEIAALFLDSDSWRVESLKIKLRKDIADQLGANRSIFHAGALEIPVSMIQSAGDTVVLLVPVDVSLVTRYFSSGIGFGACLARFTR